MRFDKIASRGARPPRGPLVLALGLLALSGCSVTEGAKDFLFGAPPPPGTAVVGGFIGAVAADEPNAALVARQVLATGGNAADAATAAGFALAATYPSRAGLGAGGACIAYSPAKSSPGSGLPEAVMFVPVAGGGSGSRPAAVPMLARGLFALSARYGSQPIETLIVPGERLARYGVRISRALATDLATVGPALLGDPAARAIFAPDSKPLAEGGNLVQPDLAATLSQLRVAGVGDLYQGAMARRLETASAQAGGPITAQALRTALPRVVNPLILKAGSDSIAFLPPPADGGLGAAAAFDTLAAHPDDLQTAASRAQAVVAAWRRAPSTDALALLRGTSPAASLPALPASTSIVVLDSQGMVVACALTMNNLFGTGRIAPGTGILLAASPAAIPLPLLTAAVAFSPAGGAFRAAVASSGQQGASLATATAMAGALRRTDLAVPEPGRVNVISCPDYLPKRDATCRWATDPRGAGIALGGSN